MKVKNFFHKVILLAATILILAACGGKSQAKEPDFPSTSFVSSTELFKVYVPTGWKTEEVVPGADLIMANSDAALEHYRSSTDFQVRRLFQHHPLFVRSGSQIPVSTQGRGCG